jgi:hypothetical protein
VDRRNRSCCPRRDHHGLRGSLPHFPRQRYESWDDLDGPAGLDSTAIRPIRDDIERVRQLIDELALARAADQSLERR